MGCTSCAQKYNALRASRNSTTSPSAPSVTNRVKIRAHRGVIRKADLIPAEEKQDEVAKPTVEQSGAEPSSDGSVENSNKPD